MGIKHNNNYGSFVSATVVPVFGTVCVSEAVVSSDSVSCKLDSVDTEEEDSSVCFGVSPVDGSVADGSDTVLSVVSGWEVAVFGVS